MTDDELIGYCDIHCETERALFSVTHINRMIDLARLPPDGKLQGNGFYSMHGQMKELVRLVRLVRLAKYKRRKPNLAIVK